MYFVRFKQFRKTYLFLARSENNCRWGLSITLGKAAKFATLKEAVDEIKAIASINIPKKPFEFDERHLFLIRLYGNSWDDQAEGLLIDMDDKIKGQILDEDLNVVETHVMKNQVWETHY